MKGLFFMFKEIAGRQLPTIFSTDSQTLYTEGLERLRISGKYRVRIPQDRETNGLDEYVGRLQPMA